jgi:diacylglycerol O-acyltransferase
VTHRPGHRLSYPWVMLTALRRVPWTRTDGAGRPPLLLQLLVIGVFLGFYDLIRQLAPGRIGSAEANAVTLLEAERSIGLDWERALNGWLAHHDHLGYVAGSLYDSLHYLVTFPLLGLVYARFPRDYRRLRDIFIMINVLGLVVFWLVPMAPPRLTPGYGYADVVADTGALGGWASTIASTADQYAAMPSLHIAWAGWVGLVVVSIAAPHRMRAAAALALAYPAVMTVIILATGNHWLLDAAAGVATVTVSAALIRATLRLRSASVRAVPYPSG